MARFPRPRAHVISRRTTVYACCMLVGVLALTFAWSRGRGSGAGSGRLQPAPAPSATPAIADGAHRDEPASASRNALAELNELLARDPANIEALLRRAVLYGKMGDRERSDADLALAIEQATSEPSVWDVKGRLLDLRGEKDGAHTAYCKAIELGSQDIKTYYNRARLRMESRQFVEAIDDWSAVIAMLSMTIDSTLKGCGILCSKDRTMHAVIRAQQ